MTIDINLERFSRAEVVAYYEKAMELQPSEAALFERWLKPGSSILDIGVGAGRTTPHLLKIADRYVGVDYAEAMVESCRKRFPGLEFHHCDATDLGRFPDREFDVVVFSFNGIDMIPSDEGRARCFREVSRVLKTGGVFIFSSHNAKALGVWRSLRTARGLRIPYRVALSLISTLRLAARAIPKEAFWRGCGYILDPTHGGLLTYTSTPSTMAPQLQAAGFDVLDVVGGPYPDMKSRYLTSWHYYACRNLRAA